MFGGAQRIQDLMNRKMAYCQWNMLFHPVFVLSFWHPGTKFLATQNTKLPSDDVILQPEKFFAQTLTGQRLEHGRLSVEPQILLQPIRRSVRVRLAVVGCL